MGGIPRCADDHVRVLCVDVWKGALMLITFFLSLILLCCIAANVQSAVIAGVDGAWTWVVVNALFGLAALVTLVYVWS